MATAIPAVCSARCCATHSLIWAQAHSLGYRNVTPARFDTAESVYPLQPDVCHSCILAQWPACLAREEIYDAEYAYFSSFSDTILKHAEAQTQMMMMPRFGLAASNWRIEALFAGLAGG